MRDIDPTELAADVSTESVRAWGLDYHVEEEPPPRFSPRMITTAAVAASLIAVLVAGVVAWTLMREPAPEAAPVPAPPTVELDVQFLNRMLAAGWSVDDPQLMMLRAHQVCQEFAQGTTVAVVKQKVAALGGSQAEADSLVTIAMQTYPDCAPQGS